ncbi:MAG TPA: bifunctional (p)ppGpp synthetase/guanosine-3',5'-bis(diphosphate) 3'-pyrophosphohydrolase, partial [Rhodobiaceae bacterium]|nr:bifunctional (p)ppGpp synthetase/guanosine-3',5'-bis(diphosphate) 3'-pyrophosphohydrolase [Rhodobiaceae bacterium]
MMRQYELVDRVVSYDPVANEDLLNRAYVYATQKHGDQKRASGDPYYSHPVEVAGILTDLHLDTASIATALLHDTIEDTDATFGEIEKIFGKEIADMVNGVTKMSLLELSSADAAQAENFRKLLLATASDVRILLVKLADRLHNMRTLHFISSEKKRRRIAQETLDIYAPLAGRIGMQNFREELEDLAFAEVNIEGRDLINERLSELKQDSGDMLEAIAYEFSALLGENGIKAHVHGRQKRPFSIWRKMQNKSISLEQLSDVFGYRVVVADEAACYQALGVLHRNFSYVPGRYKDYISTPKLNGYQSLHTTVIGPNQQRVEVQIRTEQMHEIAEKGVAAHWAYKDKQEDYPDIAKIEPFNWLQDMVAQLKNGGTAEEFLENTKLELFNDQVFCFTPKGRLIAMPRGATALDFAYAVHTEIGNSCIGVRINGLKLPFRTMLKNGDEIEIVRGEDQLPSESWLNHV